MQCCREIVFAIKVAVPHVTQVTHITVISATDKKYCQRLSTGCFTVYICGVSERPFDTAIDSIKLLSAIVTPTWSSTSSRDKIPIHIQAKVDH